MGYSSQSLVEEILANALTRGTPSSMPVDIINIGDQIRDTVSPATIVQYIRWADEEIDGALSVIYMTPLKRVVRGEYEVLSDISIGDTSITIEESSIFHKGDIVITTDRTSSEKNIVDSIPDENTLVLANSFTKSFSVPSSVIQRIGYPDPVPLCSARKAAANLYDKYFASQSDTNTSEYGNKLRSLSENDLNNLLNGRIKLHGQKFLGRRFFNPALLDVNSIASENPDRPDQK